MRTLEILREDPVLATEFNKLEARLWRIARRDDLKVITITSAVRGEGKSTTAAYLATVLGLHSGRRVLVVDFDLRIPTLNKHFDLEPGRGLEEVLEGRASVRDVVLRTELPSLDVILPSAGGADPDLLLRTQQMESAFSTMRTTYDLVLLDVPAIIPVPDATILLPYSDGVVLAGMAGKSSAPQFTRALEVCRGLDANIIGMVVSNVREAAPDYLADDYNYYGYGHARSRSSDREH